MKAFTLGFSGVRKNKQISHLLTVGLQQRLKVFRIPLVLFARNNQMIYVAFAIVAADSAIVRRFIPNNIKLVSDILTLHSVMNNTVRIATLNAYAARLIVDWRFWSFESAFISLE